jgi:poly(3-hydroxybutyrate) depolymerase
MQHRLPFRAICLGVLIAMTWSAGSRAVAGTLHKNATLVSEGTLRYWDYYVPDDLPPKAPVVFVLHGGGQTKDQMLDPMTVSPAKEWLQIADEHKVLIVIPNGVNVTTGLGIGTSLSWNDARSDNSTTSTKDDILFFNLLLDWVEENFDVGTHRIYFTGSSNGGLMCYRVAQEMSHRSPPSPPLSRTNRRLMPRAIRSSPSPSSSATDRARTSTCRGPAAMCRAMSMQAPSFPRPPPATIG